MEAKAEVYLCTGDMTFEQLTNALFVRRVRELAEKWGVCNAEVPSDIDCAGNLIDYEMKSPKG